jgi:hypothetical protein
LVYKLNIKFVIVYIGHSMEAILSKEHQIPSAKYFI